MPPRKDKRGGLTLEKLASYDDVITDALVDKVYYWATIRKNRGGRFAASRGLLEEDIANSLREHVIWNKDPSEAVSELLKLTGLRKYLATLKDERDQEQFKRHLKRYVNIYMPDCPFEVTTTNRYTITEHEASITARRDIKPREEIKYLTGIQVAMTEEQEKTLELARKDFSLVISSRKKTRSLFLGPARFANHDCGANARLSTKGYEGMQIVAVKPIEAGDEITVSYGEDYFGENNEECLCSTCEIRGVNGWAPFRRAEESSDEDEEMEESEQSPIDESQQPDDLTPHGTKRKYDSSSNDDDAPPESTPPMPKKAKTDANAPSPPKRRFSDPLRQATLKKAHSTASLQQEVPVSSIEDPASNLAPAPQYSREIRTQQRVGLLAVTLDETASSSRDTTPPSSSNAGSPKSTQSTDATSVDEEHPPESLEAPAVKVDPETILANPALGVTTVKDETTTTTVNAPWSSLFDDDTSSELSELSENMEFDSENEQIVKRKVRPTLRTTRSKSRNDAQNPIGTPVSVTDIPEEGFVENVRKPGDYMTSAALLSAKYSKWVECQTCDVEFVQQNGYRTRKECPRCERHSKLYGFAWPKTDREGKHDKEERVLDHRTVHRFVDAEEEKMLKNDKTRKGLMRSIQERFSTPRSRQGSMSQSVEVESGRRRRLRKTM